MSAEKSILVIEDNLDSRELFCEILREENYIVQAAEDGHMALEILRDSGHLPDLILMDLTFPRMTADEFVAQLNSHEQWQDIPVVVISGQVNTKEHAEKLQAKGFLKKPFDMNHFIKKVSEASAQP